MEQMQVTVPAGVGPGMPFQVNTPAGPMQVTCPSNANAGSQMMVNVPAAQPMVVMAHAVSSDAVPVVAAQPMAAPQPMMMAQPMMAQPMMAQPMAPPVALGAGGGLPWKLSLQLDKKKQLFELKASNQSPIPVISASEWGEIIEALDAAQRGNFFYDCPFCECVYWCVPGGPIQSAACLCNPISWIVCICPMEGKKAAAKSRIEAIVGKYGLKFRWDDGMELHAVIEQR